MKISPVSYNYKPNFSGLFSVNNEHVNDTETSSVVDNLCNEFIEKYPGKIYRFNHVNNSYISCIPSLEPKVVEELVKNHVSFVYKGDSDPESYRFF